MITWGDPPAAFPADAPGPNTAETTMTGLVQRPWSSGDTLGQQLAQRGVSGLQRRAASPAGGGRELKR